MRTSREAEINNKWLVTHSHKKIFAPISKNANTSVKNSILQSCQKNEFVPKDDVIRRHGNYPIVTVVRNPFDRLVSCFEFFNKVQPQYNRSFEFPTISSFPEFLKEVGETPDEVSNKHFRSQFNLLSQDGFFLPDICIDFNNLEEIKEYFPIRQLETKKVSGRRGYEGYYTDELIGIVEKRFWKDLEFFNYQFGD